MPGEWGERNPYTPEAQANLTVGLMDALGAKKAFLVGHSAGGAIALLTALTYPERVEGLVLVGAAVYTGGGTPRLVRPLLNTPQMRRLGPLFARRIQDWGIEFARSAWHDPERITPEVWKGYQKPLQAENWDRAFWELNRASHPFDSIEELEELDVPVLVITGDDDRIVPTEQSVRLAQELPGAELVVIPNCGHLPQEECPEAFLQAVEAFLARF
jgi:pimeloyl-ACP methyl ester carboxylesterase